MNIFLVHIYFLIGHIRPVCSLFENESVLKNLVHIIFYSFKLSAFTEMRERFIKFAG